MDPRTARLRALGYHLDQADRWVHAGLALWVHDPDALVALDAEQVDAFHDPAVWADLPPPPAPALEADLSRAARRFGVSWDPWLGAWLLPDGSLTPAPALEALGPDGLADLLGRLADWRAGHAVRRRAGCLGMGGMVLWLALGWLAGQNVWLIGMALIAIGTWLWRPRPMPTELWEGVESIDVEALLTRGRDRLGAGWEEAAAMLSAVPVDSDHLRLVQLDRTVAVDVLHERFSPEILVEILACLGPLDPEG